MVVPAVLCSIRQPVEDIRLPRPFGDFTLLGNRKSNAVVHLAELRYLLIAALFLLSKIIGRKAYDR